MNLEELKYDLCLGCGERSPMGQGIIAMATHSCALNTFTYRHAKFTFRQLRGMFAQFYHGKAILQSFYDLLDFPYLKAMPDYETASDFERKCYYWIREAEVKHMKRLRTYIELEEDLNSKY